jgi:hypothetical protein
MVKSYLKGAVAVAMLAGASAAANAQQVVADLGQVNFDSPTIFSGTVMGSGMGINDIFQFSLQEPNTSSGYSVVNVPLSFAGGEFNVLLSTISLFSYGNDGTYGTSDDQLLMSSTAPGGDTLTLAYDQPLSGPAYINITGVTTGENGGVYSGAIGVVPEPESFAMLLAGLGLMGAVVRRRSMNKTA